MKRFLFLVLVGWVIAAALTSCRPSKPPQADTVVGQLPRSDMPDMPDTTRTSGPPRRLFGLLPPKKVVSSPENVASDELSGGKLRKCKGCTIVYSAGPATVTTTTVGKKGQAAVGEGATASQKGDTKAKGGAVVAQDSSTTTALTGGGNLAHTIGDGNTTTQAKQDTTKEASGPLAMLVDNLTGPLGYVVGGLALAAAAYGAWTWLIPLARRRKSSDPQS